MSLEMSSHLIEVDSRCCGNSICINCHRAELNGPCPKNRRPCDLKLMVLDDTVIYVCRGCCSLFLKCDFSATCDLSLFGSRRDRAVIFECQYNVKNMCVKCGISKLSNVPYPRLCKADVLKGDIVVKQPAECITRDGEHVIYYQCRDILSCVSADGALLTGFIGRRKRVCEDELPAAKVQKRADTPLVSPPTHEQLENLAKETNHGGVKIQKLKSGSIRQLLEAPLVPQERQLEKEVIGEEANHCDVRTEAPKKWNPAPSEDPANSSPPFQETQMKHREAVYNLFSSYLSEESASSDDEKLQVVEEEESTSKR